VATWTGRIAALGLLITSAVVAQATFAEGEDPGPPSESGIQPEFHDGNPTCLDLEPAAAEWFEVTLDPPAAGTHTDGTLEVEITLHSTAAGPTFAWTSNIGVDAVFVQGGSGGDLYTYDRPTETTGDTGLHAPINDRNDMFSGLSHISFC
jgi:hypothetical protein